MVARGRCFVPATKVFAEEYECVAERPMGEPAQFLHCKAWSTERFQPCLNAVSILGWDLRMGEAG
jgi:hypothetical protein